MKHDCSSTQSFLKAAITFNCDRICLHVEKVAEEERAPGDWSVFQFNGGLSLEVTLAEITRSLDELFRSRVILAPGGEERWTTHQSCASPWWRMCLGSNPRCKRLLVFLASSEQRQECGDTRARNNRHVTHEIVPDPPSSIKVYIILWYKEVSGQLSQYCFRFVVPRTRKFIWYWFAQRILNRERYKAKGVSQGCH